VQSGGVKWARLVGWLRKAELRDRGFKDKERRGSAELCPVEGAMLCLCTLVSVGSVDNIN
jgi:hypothetical protein